MGFERRGRFGGRWSFGGGRFGGRGGFGGRPRFERSEPAPVAVGEEYDVEISEVGSKGDGIARVKNFVVFVPNTSKGDKIKIKIKELRGRSAVGEVVGGAEAPEEDTTAEATEAAVEEETSDKE